MRDDPELLSEPTHTARPDVEARGYHTKAMKRRLAKLRHELELATIRLGPTSRRVALLRKEYLQLRDYMEKISPEEFAAEIRARGRRGRR